MLSEQSILCISSIDWSFIWQGHQEIMATLARRGHRVLFIENTGVRAPGLRDMGRLGQRLRNWWKSTKGFRQEAPNLFIYSPVILPFPYSRIARWINRTLLLRALRRWMRAAQFGRPIVWTFLPTPLALDIIHDVDPLLTVYYCIDDFAASSPKARRIRDSETRLFQEADLVFVTSERLRQRASVHASRVHLFPFGVSYGRFEAARDTNDGMPEDLRRLPRPVLGYVGGLHQWVDQDLLVDVARRMPQASVVLVGPWQTDVAKLRQCPNIHLLQARPHRDIPRYIKAFDVGLVPYRLTDYTANVYPTKLNEYLAMGVPAVATDLDEIRRFNARHGTIVGVGGSASAFVEAIETAVQDQGQEARRRREAVARQNSWEARLGDMEALIRDALRAAPSPGDSWQVSLKRMYRTARQRFLRLAMTVAAGYLLLFHTPALWLAAAPLRMDAVPQQADAIVVFAGGVGESGEAGGGYQERVQHAVDLYRSGLAHQLILCSGYRYALREAEIMQDVALASGVPAEAIRLEMVGINTREYVLRSRALLDAAGWRRILLVSSPYHMRRAIWTWRHLAPSIDVRPSPVVDSRFYRHRWGATAEQILGILHEYAGIAYYWYKGWI